MCSSLHQTRFCTLASEADSVGCQRPSCTPHTVVAAAAAAAAASTNGAACAAAAAAFTLANIKTCRATPASDRAVKLFKPIAPAQYVTLPSSDAAV